jgi:type I restriction enzyme S subunit
MNQVKRLITDHISVWTAADTEKKSGRARSSSTSGGSYGVKKLRELILELAVHGKLVPQDPNDETALDLLVQIDEEKSKLVVTGKRNRTKPQTNLAEKWPFTLPEKWSWVRLGDVCSYIQRGKGPDYVEDSDVLVISQKCVRWGGLDLSSARCIDPTSLEKYESVRMLCEGDLLWNSTGTGTIGRACLVPQLKAGQSLVADSHVTVVRPIGLLGSYLWRWIQSPSVQAEIEDIASGTTNQIELNTSTVISHPLPLPPLAEQCRIVAKIDELMALCDVMDAQLSDAANAHEELVIQLLDALTRTENTRDVLESWQRIARHFDTLFTTESSIEVLEHSVLKLAVTGRLVRSGSSGPAVDTFLNEIQDVKEKLLASGKIKRSKPTVLSLAEKEPHVIPKHWKWVQLDTIAQVGTGATPLRAKQEYFFPPSINWVTSGETSNAFINKTEQHVSPLALEETNLTVYPTGTLIIAMYGQGKTRGQISELMIEACTNQACAAVRLFSDDEDHRKYVKLFFNKIYDEIRELAAGGAQPNLNLNKIKETWLPLPPIEEQRRIVSEVDNLLQLCKQLKLNLINSNQHRQKIADVLVASASL